MILRRIVLLITVCAACTACGPATARTPSAVASTIATQTTPAAPSVTETPSAAPPTRAPTAAPDPRTFRETFDGEARSWTFLQVDNGQPLSVPVPRDGFLVFDLPAPNQWTYALYSVPKYTDVTIETEVQSRTSGDGAAGLVCRYDERKGWYEVNVFADGTYDLLFGQWLAMGVARYTPLYRGETDAVRPDTNTIALECRKNLLTPFINGVQMRRWQETKFSLTAGKIGLSASSFEAVPFTVAFDSVKVSEP